MEFSNLTLTCVDPSATLSVQLAAFGNPTGSCGQYVRGSCDAPSASSVVQGLCNGKNRCTIDPVASFGTQCTTVSPRSLVVQAECSGGSDQSGYALPSASPLYAQGRITPEGNKKILVINRSNQPVTFSVPGLQGAQVAVVDESTGDGPARESVVSESSISFDPYAVAIVTL